MGTSLSSQTRKSKNGTTANKKSSSVTRKPSKSKLVAGEVKLSAIPASVEEHMRSASSTRSEKQKSNLQNQHQPLSVDAGGCDEREKVSKDKNLKSDQKSSSENKEGLKTDMYKKSSIPADPLGSLPTSHTKKYLPRQQTWAGPQGSTPPPQISPSPTQSTSSYGDDRTSSYDGAGKSRKSPFDKFRQMEQSEESSKSNIS